LPIALQSSRSGVYVDYHPHRARRDARIFGYEALARGVLRVCEAPR
jgi:hypothetical protein